MFGLVLARPSPNKLICLLAVFCIRCEVETKYVFFKSKAKQNEKSPCPRAAIDQHALRDYLRNNKMADKGWKDFQAEMKRKRVGTRAGKGKDDKSCNDELTVQRLSSEVAGKQQKYTRIGPREFVGFSGRELIDHRK